MSTSEYIILCWEVNPFAPGDFAKKRVLKVLEWFSGHCPAIKSLNLPQTGLQAIHFTAFFLFYPLFSLFLPHFFSLAGHLVGFILVGIVYRKAFRIVGLGERKGRWAMEQDFHGDFQVNVTWFFASFSGVPD